MLELGKNPGFDPTPDGPLTASQYGSGRSKILMPHRDDSTRLRLSLSVGPNLPSLACCLIATCRTDDSIHIHPAAKGNVDILR